MRPGSLVGRFRKCGKANCHCAQPPSEAHGPSWSLTRGVEGKTVTKVIPPGNAVEQTKAQIAESRRFRKLIEEFIELNVQIRDQQLAKGLAPSVSKKTVLGDALDAAVVQEVEELLGRQAAVEIDFEALEMAVRPEGHTRDIRRTGRPHRAAASR